MESRSMIITPEEKKAFLNSYIKAKYDVERLEQQLDEIHLQKVSAYMYDKKLRGSKKADDLSCYLVKVAAAEQELINARYEKICRFEKVRKSVELMTDEREKGLLTYRYLRNMKWEEIAERMIFSIQYVHKIHRKAIDHFQILK